jgi:hypothetical protein
VADYLGMLLVHLRHLLDSLHRLLRPLVVKPLLQRPGLVVSATKLPYLGEGGLPALQCVLDGVLDFLSKSRLLVAPYLDAAEEGSWEFLEYAAVPEWLKWYVWRLNLVLLAASYLRGGFADPLWVLILAVGLYVVFCFF